MNKKILLVTFGVMVVAQLLIPLQMIWNSEAIIRKNQIYFFETKPIDPHDIFRGKYVVLGFKENEVSFTEGDVECRIGQEVYVFVEKEFNQKGSYLSSLSTTLPDDSKGYNYFKTKILDISEKGVTVQMPFNRHYMNENKSLEAEQILRHDTITAYAQVAIYKGEAVLQEVLVDDIPLKDFVEKHINKKP